MHKTTAILILVTVLQITSSAQNNPADLNTDGIVNLLDLTLASENWVDMSDVVPIFENWLWTAVPDDIVSIAGGSFQMGDSLNEGYSNERPVHPVTVSSFQLARYEVTNRQYCQYLTSAYARGLITIDRGRVCQAGFAPARTYCDTSLSSAYSLFVYFQDAFYLRIKNGRSMLDDPVVQVSWYGAAAYCNWRSQQEGYEGCYDPCDWYCDFSKTGYRLPTEAEWEYAARGPASTSDQRRFTIGATISHAQANYYTSLLYGYDLSQSFGYHPLWNDGIAPYTAPVGSFGADDRGLYDMAGNVWEWCNDWYANDYYAASAPDNPTGPINGDSHVARGGSWAQRPVYCRSAARTWARPDLRSYQLGFRVVLNTD